MMVCMAQELTEEEARLALGGTKSSANGAKYPWADWTNGSWWKIVKGEDYERETGSMRTALVIHARRHSMKVMVHKRGDSLFFRFDEHVKPDPLF